MRNLLHKYVFIIVLCILYDLYFVSINWPTSCGKLMTLNESLRAFVKY